MKNSILIIFALLLSACANKKSETQTNQEIIMQANEVVAGINLTVSEGKRLIAEGIANHPLVKRKLEKGMIIVTRGTTNTYIAERLAGLSAPHGSFMTGNITPEKTGRVNENLPTVSEIVLIDGKPVEMTYPDALKHLQKDDIVMKGANMLNYERKQAALCIGAPDGGTTGRLRPYVGEGKAKFIIPVGLEKEVFGDLTVYEKAFSQEVKQLKYVPKVFVHQNGEIFTEIEALKVFGDVRVIPFAAGGIAGREGGTSLAVYGTQEEVQKVLDVVDRIQGEAPFITSAPMPAGTDIP